MLDNIIYIFLNISKSGGIRSTWGDSIQGGPARQKATMTKAP